MAEMKGNDKEIAENASNVLAKPGVVVELIRGEQWTDDLSGVSLYRGFYKMASHKELKLLNDDNEADEIQKEKGFLRIEEMNPTATLPKGKNLSRVEHALKLGILKVYDPKNPTEYKELLKDREKKSQVTYDPEESDGYRYRDERNKKLAAFLNQNITKFKEEVDKLQSFKTLEELYDAEYSGKNSYARARKPYIDALKKRMNSDDVKGPGRVKAKTVETIRLE